MKPQINADARRYKQNELTAGSQEKVKSEGAIWRPRQKLWEMPLQIARRLGLGNRIVSGTPVRAVI